MTPGQIARLLGPVAVRMQESAWGFIPPELARKARPHVVRFGEAVFTAFETSTSLSSNRVLNFGVEQKPTERLLDEILDYARAARIRRFGFHLSPSRHSDQISTWLLERGFRVHRSHAVLFRAAKPAPRVVTDLTIQRIDARHAAAFAAIAAGGFARPASHLPWLAAGVGRPGFDHFLAFDGDRAVAAGLLYIHNGCGMLAMGATLTPFRRRGAQSGIIAARIRRAHQLGCRCVVSETGAPAPGRPSGSYRNLSRLDFQHVYDLPIYVLVGRKG